MTTNQLIVVTCAYLVALVAVVYFTRATSRRVVGALAGGAVVGCFGMGAIFSAMYRDCGACRSSDTVLLPAVLPGLSISVTPIYLVTWRGPASGKGLAVRLVVVAVIGPPRDYLYAAKYPVMVFAPGIAPILADCNLCRYCRPRTRRDASHRRPSGEDRLRNES
jgi:hypothetical protein